MARQRTAHYDWDYARWRDRKLLLRKEWGRSEYLARSVIGDMMVHAGDLIDE